MAIKLYTRSELVTQAIRRLVTYSDELTYFGRNSVSAALGTAIGASVSTAFGLYRALQRRFTLVGSSGDDLTLVAAEHGARRRGERRSRLLVVFVPQSTNVTAITVGLTTTLEVGDSSYFTAGDSVRIRNTNGSRTETSTVTAILVGTGPNGGDELEIGSLGNTYTPSGNNVQVLLRHTVPLETEIRTAVGVSFRTTATIVIGDGNPLLVGEGTALALADKVWCEALVPGVVGDIEPRSVIGLAVEDPNVRRVYNPERGFGGGDLEEDASLRYRAAHRPSVLAQETEAWFEAVAVESSDDVLRAAVVPSSQVATIELRLVPANGGVLNQKRLRAVERYIQPRIRGFAVVMASSAELVAIEVEAQVQMDPDVPLRQAWIDAASRIANYLDFRRWPFAEPVDGAELLRLVTASRGVRAVVESTFTPSGLVTVGAAQLPVLVRVSLQDAETLERINADLAVSFADTEA